MAPLSLEGVTLGEKHKHFNQLVRNAIANKQLRLNKINNNEGDVQNLLNIDIACKTKNVDYIIEVLKCEDMLYVSRAIKHSTWLITEREYAHIINPEYLYTQLFPHMLTKAVNKLLLQIRLHLKDETRAESFYSHLKEDWEVAHKWLLNCSIPFIEHVIENERLISLKLFKRLCKRSIRFLRFYKKIEGENDWYNLRTVMFLLKPHTEQCLNVIDEVSGYCCYTFGKKHTKIIMKTHLDRIVNNFKDYASIIDLPTVAENVKKEDIKSFLINLAKLNGPSYFFSKYNRDIRPFIQKMPEEDRFDFVKKIYFDTGAATPDDESVLMMSAGEIDEMRFCPPSSSYKYYQYAPFNVALTGLNKLIRTKSSPSTRCAMFSVLVSSTRGNAQHIKTLLQYYHEEHRNELFQFKIKFVNNVISQIATQDIDPETWQILDDLFHSLEVYADTKNKVQTCLKYIVLYKLLHNEDVPEIVKNKMKFETFKEYRSKLNVEQQNKLFSYLLNTLWSKIKDTSISRKSNVVHVVGLVKNTLQLYTDWKKDPRECDFIRNKIQEVLKINKENSWHIDLMSIYNMNKSYRRHIFQESVMLCPNEVVCLNALKHDPQLLAPNRDEVHSVMTKNDLLLKRLLAKLRVYWPLSLAKQWSDAYLSDLNKPTLHRAVIRSLFILLSQNQSIDMAIKYIPKDSEICRKQTDQTEFSLRKNIANNVYLIRPFVPIDVVLSYARGDYLRYTASSLKKILYYMSKAQSRELIYKLLEAPVPLLKCGINFAFVKLTAEELKQICIDLWKTSNKWTIRKHLFKHTYNILCKGKNRLIVKEMWELFSVFVDNLMTEQNKSIRKLGYEKDVHESIRGQFFMKNYKYLLSLPAELNCDTDIDKLIEYAPSIIDSLDADFVGDIMLAPAEEKLSKYKSQFVELMSLFVLYGKSEEEQCRRFHRVLAPVIDKVFKSNRTVTKDNFDELIKDLIWDFRRLTLAQKIIIPVKLFSEIKHFMEQKMPVEDNYVRYTTWKLMTEYVKLVAEHKDMLIDPKLKTYTERYFNTPWLQDDIEDVWQAMHFKISPTFGRIIVKYLKEDTEKYYPTICWMFSKAVKVMFQNLNFHKIFMQMETLKYMVVDDDFVPSYLVVCQEMPLHGGELGNRKRAEIRKILAAHPSKEVQIFYHGAFDEVPE